MDLGSYRKLYPTASTRKDKTRKALAQRILERLVRGKGENVAIVGAHRSGKTTVLNIVENLVEDLTRDPKGSPQEGDDRHTFILPVRINASVTPPLSLIPEILNAIRFDLMERRKLDDSGEDSEGSSGEGSQLKELLEAALKSIRASTEASDNFGFSMFGASAQYSKDQAKEARDNLKKKHPSEFLEYILWQQQSITPTQAAQIFRRSLKLLSDFLAEFSEIFKSGGVEARILVIVDELATLSRWDDNETFPVWRHLIEASGFSAIRWLVATSRNMNITTDYSPLTNLFVEYNVGSLREPEAKALLDAFSQRSWPSEARNGEQLTPVLSYEARIFLEQATDRLPYFLQVANFHIYDRVVQFYIPIASLEVVRNLLVEEVLPDLTEYLESEWHNLGASTQKAVTDSIQHLDPRPSIFFESFEFNIPRLRDMPIHCRKSLRRSGLQGQDTFAIAPLVALWLKGRMNSSES